jgi:hypothetical protein
VEFGSIGPKIFRASNSSTFLPTVINYYCATMYKKIKLENCDV